MEKGMLVRFYCNDLLVGRLYIHAVGIGSLLVPVAEYTCLSLIHATNGILEGLANVFFLDAAIILA